MSINALRLMHVVFFALMADMISPGIFEIAKLNG